MNKPNNKKKNTIYVPMYDALIRAKIPEEDARALAIEAYKNRVSLLDILKNIDTSIKNFSNEREREAEILQRDIHTKIKLFLPKLEVEIMKLIGEVVLLLLAITATAATVTTLLIQLFS